MNFDFRIIERHIEGFKFYSDGEDNFCEAYTQKYIYFPSANEISIQQCERKLGVKLPRSYRKFLQIHDGALIATLSGVDDEIDLTNWMYADASRIVMGTEYLPQFTEEQYDRYYDFYQDDESKKAYEKRWGNIICFCYCGAEGDGSFLALDPTQADGEEYPVLHCFSTENIEQWRQDPIEKSFQDWLVPILEESNATELLNLYLESLAQSP
jgi:SMI1 / KNR4 family (SUKH-1)